MQQTNCRNTVTKTSVGKKKNKQQINTRLLVSQIPPDMKLIILASVCTAV